MSTYKFCGGKCPQCPTGSAAYVAMYMSVCNKINITDTGST